MILVWGPPAKPPSWAGCPTQHISAKHIREWGTLHPDTSHGVGADLHLDHVLLILSWCTDRTSGHVSQILVSLLSLHLSMFETFITSCSKEPAVRWTKEGKFIKWESNPRCRFTLTFCRNFIHLQHLMRFSKISHDKLCVRYCLSIRQGHIMAWRSQSWAASLKGFA